MTSAPNSAMSAPQNGPATICASSSTRMPSSGRRGAVMSEWCGRAVRQWRLERAEHASDQTVLTGQHHELHDPVDSQLTLHLLMQRLGDRLVREDMLDQADGAGVARRQCREIAAG